MMFRVSRKNAWPRVAVSPEWKHFRDSQLSFSKDWFSLHTPVWDRILAEHSPRSGFLNILEVGSWEGLSCCYLLNKLNDASLTCVDTWQGSDEHSENLAEVEENFDSNTQIFGNRVTKWKGTSSEFFRQNRNERFDFIYVDGSHYFSDVLIDALNSHDLLNLGGLLIFDDYLWSFYEDERLQPARAINVFLSKHRKDYRVVHAGGQLVLKRKS